MFLNCEHTFLWETTPRRLRDIADKIEQRERDSMPGESKIVHTVYGRNMRLDIMFDQEDAARRGNDWSSQSNVSNDVLEGSEAE